MNTELLHAEQHSLYRREWECHLLPPQLSVSAIGEPGWGWCGFESPQILVSKEDPSPTFEEQFQSKAFENKQHYPYICMAFDLLGGIHDSSRFKTATGFLSLPSFFFWPESLELSYVKASLYAFCQIPFTSDQFPSSNTCAGSRDNHIKGSECFPGWRCQGQDCSFWLQCGVTSWL